MRISGIEPSGIAIQNGTNKLRTVVENLAKTEIIYSKHLTNFD